MLVCAVVVWSPFPGHSGWVLTGDIERRADALVAARRAWQDDAYTATIEWVRLWDDGSMALATWRVRALQRRWRRRWRGRVPRFLRSREIGRRTRLPFYLGR